MLLSPVKLHAVQCSTDVSAAQAQLTLLFISMQLKAIDLPFQPRRIGSHCFVDNQPQSALHGHCNLKSFLAFHLVMRALQMTGDLLESDDMLTPLAKHQLVLRCLKEQLGRLRTWLWGHVARKVKAMGL